jgi:hypothetical protein
LIKKQKGAKKIDKLFCFSLESSYDGFIKGRRMVDKAKYIAGL